MTATSDKLARALNELPYIQAIENEQQGTAISILCRIKPGFGAQWALLAERILREAIKLEGKPDHWHTHISRVYMIRENRLVYGWTFIVQAVNLDRAVPIVIEIIQTIGDAQTNGKSRHTEERAQTRHSIQDDDYDEPEEIQEDEDYTEPDGALAKGAVPEADVAGNPIVPREHRVKRQVMAGLPKNYDRNAPDPDKGKGSWNIESRKGKPFRPPVRR